jgi:hypothetical protein
MKAQELRIGNLVRNNLNGEILKPCDVLCDGINTDKIEGLNYGFIEPIPLTEEWLFKFGFERQENNWKTLDLHFATIGWEKLAGIALSFEKESIYLPHIKYVHQLQNLYFALTNEELILNS